MNVTSAYRPARRKFPVRAKYAASAKPVASYRRRGKVAERSTPVRAVSGRSYASRAVRAPNSGGQSRSAASYRSRHSGKASAVQVPNVGPCPERYFCRLKWGEAYTLSGAISNRQVWSGNGPVDPNLAAGTSQPLGWDQLQAWYASYVCYQSKIGLRLTNRTDQSVEWVLYPRVDTQAAPSSYLEARQNEHAIFGTLSKAGGGSDIKVVTHEMKTKVIYGQNSVSQDPAFEGLTTGSTQPTSTWYWQLCVITTDGATNTTLVVDIAMEYACEFRYQNYLPIPVV